MYPPQTSLPGSLGNANFFVYAGRIFMQPFRLSFRLPSDPDRPEYLCRSINGSPTRPIKDFRLIITRPVGLATRKTALRMFS
jgi:hypothetical protein